MKGFILLVFFIILTGELSLAQSQNSIQNTDSNAVKMQSTEIKADSANAVPNAVIKTNVNKDGVIEITKKEFDKIPAVRQEMIKNNKNYKIIED